MTETVEKRAAEWIVGNDTGSSSKKLWAVMMGVKGGDRHAHPHDGADLGRCLRLLEAIPEWKPRIGEMAAVSDYWAVLVTHWEDLAKLHAMPATRGGDDPVYKRMRAILDPIEDKDRGVVRMGNGVTMRFGT